MAGELARRAALTKRAVDSFAAEPTRYTVWDSELKGFGVQIGPSGSKTYLVRYRVGGGRRGVLRQLVIGRHGVLTPDEARKLAVKALAAATLGSDPQANRVAERAELTVSELCDLYVKEGCGHKKASTLYIDGRRIERHIKPLLGPKPLSKVTPETIRQFVRDVAAGKVRTDDSAFTRGGKGAASRSTGLLGAIFAFGVTKKLMAENPAKGIKRPADNKRERFLSGKEMASLGDALAALEAEGMDRRPLTIVRLLALTGARKNEIARVKWREVDFERSRLRLDDSKTGAKSVALGAAALTVLSEIARADDAVYVFPDSKDPALPYRAIDYAWLAIRNRAGLADVRIHDLRHSFASVGVASGQAMPLIGKLLGHSHVAMTARYAHLADDPVKAAADNIASSIDAAMKSGPATVVGIAAASRGK